MKHIVKFVNFILVAKLVLCNFVLLLSCLNIGERSYTTCGRGPRSNFKVKYQTT